MRRLKPDLLFLDVQMPQLDGFGVLQQLAPDELPITILVTAYDKYAIQAFDAHAIDYLLKPFSDQRFDDAITRARRYLGSGEAHERAEQLSRRNRGAPQRGCAIRLPRTRRVEVQRLRHLPRCGRGGLD